MKATARKEPPPTTPVLALLRGINVGGHNKVAMSELRALATMLGYGSVSTYINSGNLLFRVAESTPLASVESALESAFEKKFGFFVSFVCRSAEQWAVYAKGSRFAEAQAQRPNLLLLGLSKSPPSPTAMATLQSKATAGEAIQLLDDALWFDFPNGSGRSKLTAAVIDKAVGSPTTTRNFNTVQKLFTLLSAV